MIGYLDKSGLNELVVLGLLFLSFYDFVVLKFGSRGDVVFFESIQRSQVSDVSVCVCASGGKRWEFMGLGRLLLVESGGKQFQGVIITFSK